MTSERDSFQRQDSKHPGRQSSATHFCTANADIQEYSVVKKLKALWKVGFIPYSNQLRKHVVAENSLKVKYTICKEDYFASSVAADRDSQRLQGITTISFQFAGAL